MALPMCLLETIQQALDHFQVSKQFPIFHIKALLLFHCHVKEREKQDYPFQKECKITSLMWEAVCDSAGVKMIWMENNIIVVIKSVKRAQTHDTTEWLNEKTLDYFTIPRVL